MQKQNFTKVAYYHVPKPLLLLWKIFHCWQWLNEYSIVPTLTCLLNLMLCFVLFFLFTVRQLSAFKHCFCLCCKHCTKKFFFIQGSVLVFVICSILFLFVALFINCRQRILSWQVKPD